MMRSRNFFVQQQDSIHSFVHSLIRGEKWKKRKEGRKSNKEEEREENESNNIAGCEDPHALIQSF